MAISGRSSASDSQVLIAAGNRTANWVVANVSDRGNYIRDLALEGLVHWSTATGDPRWIQHVDGVVRGKGTPSVEWRHEPFGSVTWAWASARGDRAVLDAWVDSTLHCVDEVPRSADGLFVHPRGPQPGDGNAVLIDSMQEHVCRLARAAAHSGEQTLAALAVDQMRLHRSLLRDPGTGLWSQGRGWLRDDPQRLSPGAWSRGHGWLMRGFVAAAEILPPSWHERQAFVDVIRELATALLAIQDTDGWWHAMLSRPWAGSGIEASGTAMIAAGMARAVRAGILPADPYAASARRAAAVVATRVGPDGVVADVCPGPGPLAEEGPWLAPSFSCPKHGPLALLDVTSAVAQLDRE